MNRTVLQLGYYAAMAAFVAAAGYGIVQILQVIGLLTFPWDERLIYGFSLAIAVPFLLAMLVLHHHAPEERTFWSHAALLLAVIYTMYACYVYAVQLGVALPRTIKGQTGGMQVLVLTEHSLFWTVDALAYIFMGLSTLFASFVFPLKGQHTWLKGFLLANALLTPVVALVYFYPHFSIALLMLASPWIITASGSMLLLGLYFKRAGEHKRREYRTRNSGNRRTRNKEHRITKGRANVQ